MTIIIIYIYIYKEIEREEERDKTIDKYLRHKGIQSKTQDGLIQRECFQS